MPLIKSLAASGDLVYFHDYRAGHCANQVGPGSKLDGVVGKSAGRFRTGVGFETSHDCQGGKPLGQDMDMEAGGTGAWANDGLGSVLSKEVVNPHSGTQCLRVSWPGAPEVGPIVHSGLQMCAVVNGYFHWAGWIKTDGNVIPYIESQYGYWEGELIAGVWQYFEISYKTDAITDYISFGGYSDDPTGNEYIEVDDFSFMTGSASLGYIRVADNEAFFPPDGGLCLIASYLQSNAGERCMLIGQGSDAVDVAYMPTGSWALYRTPTQIQFVVQRSDLDMWAMFAYNIAAVQGQVETITVRYTGHTTPNNCTISVIAPTPSSSTGTISSVPQDSKLSLSIGCQSDTDNAAFHGVIRYVSYVRGGQTAASLAALAAEMEAVNWPDAVEVFDTAGSVADRAVQYMSKFGADASIANEGGVVNGPLSNSGWIFGNARKQANGTWRVAPYHSQHDITAGGPADLQKCLLCATNGNLRLPLARFGVDVTPTLAAYGTWDFWLYHKKGSTTNTWVVYKINGANDDGYVVRLDTEIRLGIISAGVWAQLITTAINLTATFIHIRVTRTLGGDWKLFYQLCNSYGVPGRWVYAGTARDATTTTSDGMFLDYDATDALMIGNHRSEKALLKWRGVVDAL